VIPIAAGGHRDRVRDLRLVHARKPAGSGALREGQLHGVVKAAGHEVAVVDQPRLDRITHRHPEHQIPAAAPVHARRR
jgi:hypothetical protein